MKRFNIFFTLITIVCCLFVKDFAPPLLLEDVASMLVENSQDKDSSEKKEQERQKEADEKNIHYLEHTSVNKILSLLALSIVSERKYHTPTFDVISPPPELV